MGNRLILPLVLAILLLSSTAFALDLSSNVYEPGDTVYFSGTIPKYDDCSNSRVDVRTLLYDPVFGYLKLGNETYERNEDGSFDVEGSYDLSEYANGKYKLVENIAYLCFDSDKWKTYGDFMGDVIYENEFTVTDPVFDNITKNQAGTYGKVYEFDLKEIADIDLLLAYDWHIKCKVNDEIVINNDQYDAVMENSWDGEEGYHIKRVNITDNLKIGKNKVECGSHQRVVGPYSGPYCPPPQDGRWCIHQEHWPGRAGSCSCCWQCFNAPGADFDFAVRKHNPNLATWTLGKDDYMYELPVREDKWYSRTAEFYVVDEDSDTFEVRKGAIPWSEDEQTIYWNTNLDNITDKWIYISTPTEASCNINGASFTLSESFYNDDEYWIWKVPSNYLEQGINDFECTVPKSEEYLNFFDIKIDVEPIAEPKNLIELLPLAIISGGQDQADTGSSGSSYPTNPTTEAALGVVALTAAAGLGAYTMGSKRASYFAWLKGEKQKYNEHLAGIEARNQEIRGWIPQVKEKVDEYRKKLYEAYLQRLQNASSYEQQASILSLMASDSNLGKDYVNKAKNLKIYDNPNYLIGGGFMEDKMDEFIEQTNKIETYAREGAKVPRTFAEWAALHPELFKREFNPEHPYGFYDKEWAEKYYKMTGNGDENIKNYIQSLEDRVVYTDGSGFLTDRSKELAMLAVFFRDVLESVGYIGLAAAGISFIGGFGYGLITGATSRSASLLFNFGKSLLVSVGDWYFRLQGAKIATDGAQGLTCETEECKDEGRNRILAEAMETGLIAGFVMVSNLSSEPITSRLKTSIKSIPIIGTKLEKMWYKFDGAFAKKDDQEGNMAFGIQIIIEDYGQDMIDFTNENIIDPIRNFLNGLKE